MDKYQWYTVVPKKDNAIIFDQYGSPIGTLFGQWDVKGLRDESRKPLVYYYMNFDAIGFPSGYVLEQDVWVSNLKATALSSDEAQIAFTNLYAQTEKALAEANALVSRIEDIQYLLKVYLDYH